MGVNSAVNFYSSEYSNIVMVELIGVTGPSCSGKSTVCRALAERDGMDRFSLDNFYKPKEDLETDNYDHPSAIKFEVAYRALKKLKQNEKVKVPEYDKVKSRVVGENIVEPSQVMFVDGFMILYHGGIRSILDKSIFLDIPKQEQLKRRRKRFNRNNLDMDEEYFHKCVYPAYENYILPTKRHADYVIDADRDLEEVVKEVESKV